MPPLYSVLAKWQDLKKLAKSSPASRTQIRKSKFGLERFVRGPLDLMSVTFITRFGRRPHAFFWRLGTIMFILGGGVSIYLLAEKVYKSWNNIPTRNVTDKPLFYLALLAIILGVQLFLSGFLGELISRNSSDRNKYQVEKEI
jgi:hypothetical protein